MVDAVRNLVIANVIAIKMAQRLIVVGTAGVEIHLHIDKILNQHTIVTVLCVLLLLNPQHVHVEKEEMMVDVVRHMAIANVIAIKEEKKIIVVRITGVSHGILMADGIEEMLDLIVTVVCVLLFRDDITTADIYYIFLFFNIRRSF